jgi:preprotein translocase subunit SecD
MFKKLAIVFTALFCVMLAVPTLSPKLAPYFPSWIGPVSLGLDLKGGAQLLLEVDTNTLFQEKTQQLYEETRSALIDRNKGVIRFSGLRNHDGFVSLVVRNEEEVSSAKGRLKATF